MAVQTSLFQTGTEKGAIISGCGKYRFQLWRIWDASKPKVLWIMHNPSTADADNDDRTVSKIIRYTKSWGYGGLYVGNLYPFRATDPKELLHKPFEEVCPLENLSHIKELVKKCELHILAYGNPVIAGTTPELFDEHWHYLKINEKSGNPAHPLYLKGDLKPVPFSN